MKELIEKNYDSTCKRGLITEHTNHIDFLAKLYEELNEVILTRNKIDLGFELADVILVCLNYARHYDIDIEYYLTEKIKINYERSKKGI